MTRNVSTPESSQVTPTQGYSKVLGYAMVLVPLLSAWAIFLYLGLGSLFSTEKNQPNIDDNKSKAPTLANETEIEPEAPTIEPSPASDYKSIESAFVLQLQKQLVESRLKQAEETIEKANQDIANFKNSVDSLLENEAGRRLATPQLARKFAFVRGLPMLQSQQRPDSSLDDIQKTIRHLKSPTSDIQLFMSKIDEIESFYRSKRQDYSFAENALQQLLAKSQTEYPVTLSSVLSQLNASDLANIEAKSTENKISTRERYEREITTRQNTETFLIAELEKAETDLAEVKSQLPGQIQRAQNSTAKTTQELLEKNKRKIAALNANYASVRNLLSPFVSKGYRQPTGRSRSEITINNQPVSYSRLQRLGALTSNQQGLRTLYEIAQAKTDYGAELNNRPMGSFPSRSSRGPNFDNESVQQQLKTAQAFLIKYGQSMVTKGLLSK